MAKLFEIQSQVIGQAAVAQGFIDVNSRVRSRLRKELMDIGARVAMAAQAAAPKDTGKLAKSIKASLKETGNKMTEQIRAGKKYGIFLEKGVVFHGTKGNRRVGGHSTKGAIKRLHLLRSSGNWRIRPRPFMMPAFDAMREQIQERLHAVVSEAATKE